jgi:hypothetical protein
MDKRKPSKQDRNHISFISKMFLIFSILAVLVGCGGKTANLQLSPADTEKLNPILEQLQVRYRLTSTLKMPMRVTIEDKAGKEEVREYLWYKRSVTDGELLHIQAMGPYNEPRVVAIAARNRFLLRLINEEEAYFEPLADGVLREIFRMDLRVSDVRNAIFANPFLDGNTNITLLAHSGAKYVVTRPGSENGQTEEITIFVRNDEPEVHTWIIRDENGGILQHAKFSDYREVGGILHPHKVEIERPPEQTRVTFKATKPEINVEIHDNRFNFEPFLTENTKIRSLEK